MVGVSVVGHGVGFGVVGGGHVVGFGVVGHGVVGGFGVVSGGHVVGFGVVLGFGVVVDSRVSPNIRTDFRHIDHHHRLVAGYDSSPHFSRRIPGSITWRRTKPKKTMDGWSTWSRPSRALHVQE